MGGYRGGNPPTSAGEAGASTPEVAKTKGGLSTSIPLGPSSVPSPWEIPPPRGVSSLPRGELGDGIFGETRPSGTIRNHVVRTCNLKIFGPIMVQSQLIGN